MPIRLLALEVIALLLLPLLSSALGGRRKVALAVAEDEHGDSESASFPSRKGGGTGSMLLRLDLYDAEAATGPRRLEGGRRVVARELSGRFVARELAGRVEDEEGVAARRWGVTGTGREDLREVAVSEREKAAEGGRMWTTGSETMRELSWLRRPDVGTVEGAVVYRGM